MNDKITSSVMGLDDLESHFSDLEPVDLQASKSCAHATGKRHATGQREVRCA